MCRPICTSSGYRAVSFSKKGMMVVFFISCVPPLPDGWEVVGESVDCVSDDEECVESIPVSCVLKIPDN